MVEPRQIPVNTMVRPVGPGLGPNPAAMTPKDIVGILRRHVLLIISLTILGFMVGGVSWYLMRKYSPRYIAQTFIRVLPPIIKDPMTIATSQVNKDIQYGYRMSMASLIRQQSTFQKLIDRDKIRQTEWFKNFGKTRDRRIVKAVRNLKKKLGASAQRDGDYIVVSMGCKDKNEAALIVNEMVDLFLSLQGSS